MNNVAWLYYIISSSLGNILYSDRAHFCFLKLKTWIDINNQILSAQHHLHHYFGSTNNGVFYIIRICP